MDKAGVSLSVLSVPNAWYNPEPTIAPRLSRDANEFMARMRQDYPGRFGIFAHLPLPHVDTSLREIEYAFDTLKADGVGLMTDYYDKWLGDPSFAPVFDELNRRNAVVYTHPKAMDCCQNVQPYINDAIIEYGTDTTRAIASIVFQGLARRCPNIRFIFSHAGGTMPFLIERFIQVSKTRTLAPQVPGGVESVLRTFYYDTAQATHPIALGALTKLVPASQVVFGTDYPFRTSLEHVKGIRSFGFSETDVRAIEYENAKRLMPRLNV
jgi:predicted TIM-barrel fold metal-dependent hydrolase